MRNKAEMMILVKGIVEKFEKKIVNEVLAEMGMQIQEALGRQIAECEHVFATGLSYVRCTKCEAHFPLMQNAPPDWKPERPLSQSTIDFMAAADRGWMPPAIAEGQDWRKEAEDKKRMRESNITLERAMILFDEIITSREAGGMQMSLRNTFRQAMENDVIARRGNAEFKMMPVDKSGTKL